LQYALRLCTQKNRLHASVVLYGELGLFDEAVGFALKVKYHDVLGQHSFSNFDSAVMCSIMIWNWRGYIQISQRMLPFGNGCG
jgi:hypothetical protein